MNPLEALLLFIGIPAGLALIIYTLVSASAWTRSGRASADYDSGPMMVRSDPAVPNPSIVDTNTPSLVGGGASAQW